MSETTIIFELVMRPQDRVFALYAKEYDAKSKRKEVCKQFFVFSHCSKRTQKNKLDILLKRNSLTISSSLKFLHYVYKLVFLNCC